MNKTVVNFVCGFCYSVLVGTNHTLAQSSPNNYVKVYKALEARTGNLSTVNDKNKVAESIVYYDGLGREIQSVSRRGSPLGKDIVTFSAYDGYGKKTISYLPYVANQSTGNVVADPKTEQMNFYISLFGTINGQAALSTTVIESSELSRVIEQSSAGDPWKIGSGNTVKTKHLTNVASDGIRRFIYSETTGISLAAAPNDLYPEYSLTCTKTVDEDENDVLTFVDKEGRTVCKKVKAPGNVYASTYYIYDDFGNLVVVIPPEGVSRILNQTN